MKNLIMALMIVSGTAAIAKDFFGVGQRDFVFEDTARHRKLATHVWYPIDSKTTQKAVVEKFNPFIPVVAVKDAPFTKTPTRFPLILLSHGSGGKADKLFWLTDRFVKSGSIVLAVDHPGNMTGDNSGDGMVRIWERPMDLSFVLDRLLEEKDFKERIDLSKVGAIGHSAGATTVLLLAGARLSADKLTSPTPNCVGTKDPYFAKWCKQLNEINFKSYAKEIVEKDYSDPRVKAVIAFDPGFARSFRDGTFEHLSAKPLLFLADKLNSPHDEIYSKEFLKLLPNSTEVVPNSYHMTFLQACKPGFPKDDAELNELCIENEKKLKIQEQVAAKALKFLQR